MTEKCYISVRDIQTEYIWDGFKLTLITDVPSHLFMRWSINPPRIHDKPVYRRGIFMHGDRYFCFTVYQDNEQEEAGDTLVHTFIKHDWPHCSTRYFYFWGEVSGVACQSTTAIFKLHFEKEKAPPKPEVMYTFNSIEPQFRSPGTGDLWKTMDLSHELPVGSTGAIIQIQNTDISVLRRCGLRKPSSTAEVHGQLMHGNYTWGLVGTDADRKIEAYAPTVDVMIYWVMGYTGSNVHFLDSALEFTLVKQVWNDLDCSPYVPADADAAIFNVSALSGSLSRYAIRKKGSTDVHYSYFYQNFPILGLDENKKAEIWPIDVGVGNVRCFLTGYIVGGVQMHTNSIDISPAVLGSWQHQLISAYNATTHFAIIETSGAAAVQPWGVRKGASLRPILGTVRDHQWCYPHCDTDRLIDIYRSYEGMHFYEIGVTD